MGWVGTVMASIPRINFAAYKNLSLSHFPYTFFTSSKKMLILMITNLLPESSYFWEMRRLEEINLGSLIRKRKERESLKRWKAI